MVGRMKTHTSQSRGTTRLASELNVVFIKELFNYFANVWILEILSKNKLYTFFYQRKTAFNIKIQSQLIIQVTFKPMHRKYKKNLSTRYS